MSTAPGPESRQTDVLVIGAGAAGMYAAWAAATAETTDDPLDVTLLDKSMVGRGGATVMAQMTVAAAVGHAEPDSSAVHLSDTLAGGRRLNDPALAALLCEDGPARIHETRGFGVRWAADDDVIRQVSAPGHSRARCCYVDVLATGQSTSTGLRRAVRLAGVTTLDSRCATDLIRDADGAVVGAVVLDSDTGTVEIWRAGVVVLAAGGLTELYARNSAAVTMTGDAYALALHAGAELIDMEMVQFFPIANLAPRLIGLDPIMWDPFRYKLGGRLVNGEGEEFIERYTGVADEGTYTATRDLVSYAILKEVEAGRGSPAGGAWLDFTGCSADAIHEAFPPVVDKLAAQGIDLTTRRIEVSPMAHYMIGGIRADADMRTGIPGLLACGEAVGGAHGANRLSGNAITEAFTFGHRAGRTAALDSRRSTAFDSTAAAHARNEAARISTMPGSGGRSVDARTPELRSDVKRVMQTLVGPLRHAEGLTRAGSELAELRTATDNVAVGPARRANSEWVERIELDAMLVVGESVRRSAEERCESRGAHQREDHPDTVEGFERRVACALDGNGEITTSWRAVADPTRSVEMPALAGRSGGAQ